MSITDRLAAAGPALPIAAGVLAAGVAVYFAIYAVPTGDDHAKARSVGQKVHDALAHFGQTVKKDVRVAERDTGRFFTGQYDQQITKAFDKGTAAINKARDKAVGSLNADEKKADTKINAAHLPPAVKAVARFGVDVGTTVAKDAVKVGTAIAKAGVTVGHDAVIVAEHVGNDVGHVGLAVGDLFKHPGNIGHDLKPIADDFKHLFDDVKHALHPHKWALQQITNMQSQYDGDRRQREKQIASDVIQADVTARKIPVATVQAALGAGAVDHLAAAMASWTIGLVNAQRVDKTSKANVSAVAAIYQQSDADLTAQAAALWKASGDYATLAKAK